MDALSLSLNASQGWDAGPLASLKAASQDGGPAASDRLEMQVESMFTSILLKTLRQTLEGDGLFPGDKSDSLGALFDQFMGTELAKGGGVGMGKMMASYVAAAKAAESAGS